MQIREAALVRSGLVLARKQSKGTTKYRYKLLTLRSIASEGYIDTNSLDIFDATQALDPEYLTHKGDIVVRLSTPYTAVLIDEFTEGILLSSNFVVLRANRSKLLPEYLIWLLNTPKLKKDIYKSNAGNMLGAIRPQYYSDLEVVLLPIEQQRKVARLNCLAKKETELLRELAQQKEIYYQSAIDKIQKVMRKETEK